MATNGCPGTPSRRARRDRGEAGDIAVGDRTLRLREGIRKCLTMGDQILLQCGMDYIRWTATLDFGDQPRSCINDRAPGLPGRGNVRLGGENAGC